MSKKENISVEQNEENNSLSDEMRIEVIEDGLRRKYLSRLTEMEVSPITGLLDLEEDIADDVRLYQVTEIAYQKDVCVIDRLTTVF